MTHQVSKKECRSKRPPELLKKSEPSHPGKRILFLRYSKCSGCFVLTRNVLIFLDKTIKCPEYFHCTFSKFYYSSLFLKITLALDLFLQRGLLSWPLFFEQRLFRASRRDGKWSLRFRIDFLLFTRAHQQQQTLLCRIAETADSSKIYCYCHQVANVVEHRKRERERDKIVIKQFKEKQTFEREAGLSYTLYPHD